MLKLYKRGRGVLRYWEAWKVSWAVVVHEGRVGERGRTRFRFPDDGRTPEQCIRAEAAKPRAGGYAEVPLADHIQIVVQYRLTTWGGPHDLDKGRRIEALFNECLGWTGNGRCDGNDVGSGTLNIFSVVVDAEIGAACLVAELRKHRLLRGAVVAVRMGDEYRVVYPTRRKQPFSLF